MWHTMPVVLTGPVVAYVCLHCCCDGLPLNGVTVVWMTAACGCVRRAAVKRDGYVTGWLMPCLCKLQVVFLEAVAEQGCADPTEVDFRALSDALMEPRQSLKAELWRQCKRVPDHARKPLHGAQP